MGRSKKNKEKPLSPQQKWQRRQRQMVLGFVLLFSLLGLGGCLQPWYSVSLGTVTLSDVDGAQRNMGKVYLLGCGLVLFFGSFNLVHNERLHWPMLASVLVMAGSLLGFGYAMWSDNRIFEELTQQPQFKDAVLKGVAGSDLSIQFRSGLWLSCIGCLNGLLGSAFLIFAGGRGGSEDSGYNEKASAG